MVLADTSVWVAHFRAGESRLETLLNDGQIMAHDFIIGELACGNLRNRKQILSLLQTLPHAPVVDQEEFLYFIERQRMAGLGLGFVDAHLLASAKLAGVPLWTSDEPLRRAAEKLGASYHHPAG